MFDSKLNYDSKAFIDGKELFGVTSFDISYSNSLDVLSVLGSRNGIHASSSPTSSKVSISRDFICRDDFLNKTGSTGVYSDFSFVNQAIPFSGGLYYNSKLYGFTGGYVSNYSVNCAVGSVPKNSVVFDVFDVIQEMPLYIKNKNFVNFKNPGFDSMSNPAGENASNPFWRKSGGRGLQSLPIWHAPGAYQGDFFYVQDAYNGIKSSLSQFVYFPERTSGNISIWVSTRNAYPSLSPPQNMSLFLNSSLKQTINSGELQTNGIWTKKIFSGIYIESGWNEISFVFSGNGSLVVDYVSINDNDPPNTLQKVNQGSIVISSPNSSTNRVVGFDYSMTKNNMPIYSVGSTTPVFVESMYPITYNASVQIEVDDAFLSNSNDFFTYRNDKNIYLSINGIESIPSFFAQVPGNFTWSGASSDATAKGGRLAIINTLQKQKEVESLKEINHLSDVFDFKSIKWARGRSTNFLLHSNNFDNGVWIPVTDETIRLKNITGPDGVPNSAWSLDDLYSNIDTAGIEQLLSIVPSISRFYTFSFFAKQGTAAYFDVYCFFYQPGVAARASFVRYTWDTAQFIGGSGENNGFTPISLQKTSVGNGWFRFSFTAKDSNTGLGSIIIYRIYPSGRDAGQTGTTYFYGNQVEMGSNATAYSPTTTSLPDILGNFFTMSQSTITTPNNDLTAFTFISTDTTSQGLFLRAWQSQSDKNYTLSVYIYMPAQNGINSWGLSLDAADSGDIGASSAQTEFNAWVKINIPIKYTQSRDFLDFNIIINGGAPTIPGIVFHVWYPFLKDFAKWIGGSYNASSSKFVNVDGSYVDDGYKNWQTNKPDINDGLYMNINKDDDYKWNTSANVTKNGYIIEFLEVVADTNIKKFAIPNATLVSEKLTASSDGVLNLTLEYIGTS